MRDPQALETAWRTSKAFSTLPSILYDIDDPLAAWSFNNAVAIWGLSLEGAIDKATEGAKNNKEAQRKAQAAVAKYMGMGSRKAVQQFRDPAAARG